MAASHFRLIATLINKKLYVEVDRILAISRQGFDIHVKVEFPEVERALVAILEKELSVNSREFRLIRDPEQIYLEADTLGDDDKDIVFMPTLLLSAQQLQSGYGFIPVQIPAPDELIGSIAFSIEAILKHFNLDMYLDVFDAQKFSRLKQVTHLYGLNILIDAVVQTAYMGGFCGDVEKAQNYLNSLHLAQDASVSTQTLSPEKCAEIFLSHVALKGENAHAFLKASLSYYMLNQQGFSTTRASQTLSISRTTLQEHIKLANQLGVQQFFEGQH